MPKTDSAASRPRHTSFDCAVGRHTFVYLRQTKGKLYFYCSRCAEVVQKDDPND